MTSDETPQESSSTPDWFAGFDDQASPAERRRRANHIENVHVGDYLIVIDRQHQMIGTPLKVLGVSAPMILTLDDVHEVLHCLDIRQHRFVHASDDYVINYLKFARKQHNQALALGRAARGDLPSALSALQDEARKQLQKPSTAPHHPNPNPNRGRPDGEPPAGTGVAGK